MSDLMTDERLNGAVELAIEARHAAILPEFDALLARHGLSAAARETLGRELYLAVCETEDHGLRRSLAERIAVGQ